MQKLEQLLLVKEMDMAMTARFEKDNSNTRRALPVRHVISVNQLTNKDIYSLLETADRFQHEQLQINQQLFAANLFFEPSTRTKMSVVVAQKKLGMEELDFHC